MGCAMRAAAPLPCGAERHLIDSTANGAGGVQRCGVRLLHRCDAQLCSCCARAAAKPIALLKNVDSVSHMSGTGLRGTGLSGRGAERERRSCALLKNVSHMSESLRCSLGMCCTCTQSIQSIACPALPAVTADLVTLWTDSRTVAPSRTDAHTLTRARTRAPSAAPLAVALCSSGHYRIESPIACMHAHCTRGMCSRRAHAVSNSMQYPAHAQNTPVGRQTLQRIDRFGFDARTHARVWCPRSRGWGLGWSHWSRLRELSLTHCSR